VNIDGALRRNIATKVGGVATSETLDPAIFADAISEMRSMFNHDAIPRFMRTAEFTTAKDLAKVRTTLVAKNAEYTQLLAQMKVLKSQIDELETTASGLQNSLHDFGCQWESSGSPRKNDDQESSEEKIQEKRTRRLSKKRSSKLKMDDPTNVIFPKDLKKSPDDPIYVMLIDVIQAKELFSSKDKVGPCYVEIRHGKTKLTSSSIADYCPRWRESFKFKVRTEDRDKLEICVWGPKSAGSHGCLGQIRFASPRVFVREAKSWYTLEPQTHGDYVTGKLRLDLHYRRQRDAAREVEKRIAKLENWIKEEESLMVQEDDLRTSSSQKVTGNAKLLKSLRQQKSSLEKKLSGKREKQKHGT